MKTPRTLPLSGCLGNHAVRWRTWGPLARLAAITLAFCLPFWLPGAAIGAPVGFVVSEYQPDVRKGGRADTIAVHPTNDNIMLVASNSGGLFRSVDGGTTWRHVDELPVVWARSVAFHPANPNVVIATGGDMGLRYSTLAGRWVGLGDFRVASNAGIWRSDDGGINWVRIPAPPAPAGVPDRFSAAGISIAPDTGTIYVATSWGVAIGSPTGTTWTYSKPFPDTAPRVASILALNGGLVMAGGPAGVRVSEAGGPWVAPTVSPGRIGAEDIHAFARSPFVPDHAYLVDESTRLYLTEDRGKTWKPLPSPLPPESSACGGIPFIKATSGIAIGSEKVPVRAVVLFYGNRCSIARLGAPVIPRTTPNRFNYNGTWSTMPSDHGDTRDLGLDSAGQPLLLATDGGLHRTPDGLAWQFTGGGSAGYNALQITEIKGQWIRDINAFDLYFGTQDNGLSSLVDGAANWETVGTEGYFIDAERSVPNASAARITYAQPDGFFLSPRGFPNPLIVPWKSPPRVAGPPKVIRESEYVQAVAPPKLPSFPGAFTSGFAITRDLGTSWSPYARFSEQPRAIPKLSDAPSSAVPGLYPVLYQAVRVGTDSVNDADLIHLLRAVENPLTGEADVFYPEMKLFGGLGITPTMFAWYPVFAVDPGNGLHLIAPDVINEKMKESPDGGKTWTDMAALTSLVTDGGKLQFRNWIFSQASAISFSPDDPNMVAVGTMEGGVLVSSDRGKTWTRVPGSARASFITSLEWRTRQELIVSTYGRGLWRLNWQLLIKPEDLTCPPPCFSIKIAPPFRPLPVAKLGPGVAVLNGEIRGVDTSDGVLTELFVSPGSAVSLVSDSTDAPRIKVTETTHWVGFGTRLWRVRPHRRMVVALGLTPQNKVSDIVLAKGQLSSGGILQSPTVEQLRGNVRSPTAGKPYIYLATGAADSQGPAPLDRNFTVVGRGFRDVALVEITLNDAGAGRATPDRDGNFSLPLKAPPPVQGIWTVAARDPQTGRVLDASMVLIGHKDKESGGN